MSFKSRSRILVKTLEEKNEQARLRKEISQLAPGQDVQLRNLLARIAASKQRVAGYTTVLAGMDEIDRAR